MARVRGPVANSFTVRMVTDEIIIDNKSHGPLTLPGLRAELAKLVELLDQIIAGEDPTEAAVAKLGMKKV